MKADNILAATLIAAALGLGIQSFGVETTTEKVQAMGNKTGDAVARTYRNAKDEVCEMIDGKEKCIVKKVVNKVKSTADKVETTTKETINKVD